MVAANFVASDFVVADFSLRIKLALYFAYHILLHKPNFMAQTEACYYEFVTMLINIKLSLIFSE